MDTKQLAFAPISEQSVMIQEKRISPVELVDAYLQRIDELDGPLASHITVASEEARRDARIAADEIASGAWRGPLHGIPYGVKDQMRTAGLPTTLAFRPLADNVTSDDATVVRRLAENGAILVGKHNLDQFGKGGTVDWDFGRARNPWDLDHTPMGSSAGSGSAVAAGFSSFSLGEDTGGSIRNPAAANGIVGIRPTFGLVSRAGGYMHSWTNDTIGPLARSTRDVALVLRAIAGRDIDDLLTSDRPVPDYVGALSGDIRGLRVGIVENLLHDEAIDAEVQDLTDDAIDVLRALGAETSSTELHLAKHAVPLQMLTCDADVGSVMMSSWMRTNYADIDFGIRTRLAAGCLVPAVLYSKAMRGRAAVREEVLAQFSQFDVLVCPTIRSPAAKIDSIPRRASTLEEVLESVVARRKNAYPFSVANTPALSVPMGFTRAGLPVGLQIVGRPFDESTVLRVGDAYERATNWTSHHPDVEGNVRDFISRTAAAQKGAP